MGHGVDDDLVGVFGGSPKAHRGGRRQQHAGGGALSGVGSTQEGRLGGQVTLRRRPVDELLMALWL